MAALPGIGGGSEWLHWRNGGGTDKIHKRRKPPTQRDCTLQSFLLFQRQGNTMRNKTLLLSFSALLLCGCTQTFLVKLDPQSHFDYPNSNIYPMGHAEGKISKTTIFSIPEMSSAFQYEAISKALESQPGSDMLINSVHMMDITSVLFFTTTTYRVEGTAARMKAGEQVLR
jgi:hypothetical protein